MRCLVIGLSASHQKYGKVPNKEKRGEIKEGLERVKEKENLGNSHQRHLRTTYIPIIHSYNMDVAKRNWEKRVFMRSIFFYTSTYGSTKYKCCLVHLRSVAECNEMLPPRDPKEETWLPMRNAY